ncbi:MAG TPA: hypothetical protein VFD49_07845 [Candidatus Dormibacteraeota bacterium]|nr:hypothetical protein [Candidatus Dormibacteraeota bacterium]
MFDITDRQVHLSLMLSDIIAAVTAMAPLRDESDVARAFESLPRLEQELQQAVQLSKDKDIPPELRALTSHMVSDMGDLERLLRALQVGDVARFREAGSRLAQDAQDVNGYDPRATNAYDHRLLGSYVDRYRRSIREAGFQLGS